MLPAPGDFVAWFLPADGRTAEEVWFGDFAAAFPFAENGDGDYYFVKVPNPDVCPVWFWSHDGGEVSRVADSLDEWASRPIAAYRSPGTI